MTNWRSLYSQNIMVFFENITFKDPPSLKFHNQTDIKLKSQAETCYYSRIRNFCILKSLLLICRIFFVCQDRGWNSTVQIAKRSGKWYLQLERLFEIDTRPWTQQPFIIEVRNLHEIHEIGVSEEVRPLISEDRGVSEGEAGVGNCPPTFWQNRRRRRRWSHAALLPAAWR